MKKALIIFVRNPDRGKTKTRIAAILGDEAAIKVYTILLTKTHAITENIDVDRFVFYADYISTDDLWQDEHYTKKLQNGNDLGTRMSNAFETLFSKGYKQVAIIGSDCSDLTTEIINEAFVQLNNVDVVIGPAYDGGYYLLGMNRYLLQLFKDKKWSTLTVYQDTFDQAQKLGLTVFVLPTLRDVDEVGDITFEY